MPAAMPAAKPEPTGLIPAVRVVHLNLTRVLDDLSDAESRGPSRLPGWSRGHVVTHLARNADGLRRMLEGAIAGTVTAMYEGGAASRAADIEAGADRPASVLRDDAISAAAAVDVVWDHVSDEVWATGRGAGPFGEFAVSEIVFRRLREVEVHLVDLGLERFTVDHWSDPYVRAELPLTIEGVAERLPAGIRLVLQASDTGDHFEVGAAEAPAHREEQPIRRLLGWLLGRCDIVEAPTLKPW